MIFPFKRTSKDRPAILDELARLDFRVYIGSAYDLNIIGARSPSRVAGSFDDHLHVCYRAAGVWVEEVFQCTTDPGLFWLDSPMRIEGCAIMVSPQQVRAGYEIGSHRGEYPCLVQRLPVRIWRDNNRDQVLDMDGIFHAGWGIQIHRASRSETSTNVGKWSAGCTVVSSGWDRFWTLIHLQRSHGFGSLFTYTLIDGVFLGE